jgi:dUTP pyrophosphatase
MNLPVKYLPNFDRAFKLTYAQPGDVGFDLFAMMGEEGRHMLGIGERILVRTGIAVALPYGYELQVRPRSGLALKNGITVLNSPGTIDAGYRGEIGVILINHGNDAFNIVHGMRIAQAVINKVALVEFEAVEELPRSARGADGFGSTGI